MSKLRIDKYLSECKICTRTEAEKYIRQGRIFCNGIPINSKNYKIEPNQDTIIMDGTIIQYEPVQFFMMNKPAGIVCATKDNTCKTVCDLLNTKFDLFPIGRLDKDTEGLLLLTNDGETAHNLLSPKNHVSKTYYVEGVGPKITDLEIQKFQQGFDYGEKKISKSAVLVVEQQDDSEFSAKVTITEGKYHQVKRMFQKFSQKVTYLKRIQMGTLELDPKLLPGEVRKLSVTEIAQLKKNGK